MSRFYSLGTWLFISVAIALALLAPLTVPEGAMADTGSGSAAGGGGTQCPNNPNPPFGCLNPGAQCNDYQGNKSSCASPKGNQNVCDCP
jgi:hypothetical protein